MEQNSNFNKYHSETIRFRGWNYSSESTYFITIRTKQKGNILGEIIDGKMHANKIGQIAEEFINEISKHFNNTTTHASVIMPDHVHILLEINKHGSNKPHHGVALQRLSLSDASRHGVMRQKQSTPVASRYSVAKLDIKRPPKGSLSIMINQYKGVVKRYCNKNNIEFKWQNKFFDRIIRDENELENTINYIHNNPKIYWRKHNIL